MDARLQEKCVDFVCPRCKANVATAGDRLRCAGCGADYAIDVIPNFMQHAVYYGEVEQGTMALVVEAARQGGYREAVVQNVSDAWTRRYLLDTDRSRWIELLPTRSAAVLEIGCGCGANSIALSDVCDKLYCIDSTVERALVTHYRCRAENRPNVSLACASALSLPLPDRSVDVITLNGVLEWLASGTVEQDPRDVQLLALREAARVLRPGGVLYIGIENRWSLRYWLGDRDDHSSLRFTTVLPRWAASLVTRRRQGRPYRTYTYGVRGYRKLLEQAGFVEAAFHWPQPNYKFPDRIVPLTRSDMARDVLAPRPGLGSPRKVLRWVTAGLALMLNAYPMVAHSFCIIARTPAPEGPHSARGNGA